MLHERAIDHLLRIKEIYLEPEVYKHQRGLEILEKYPGAQIHEVASHWKIPQLFGFEGSVADWISNKRDVLILGIKKSLTARPNSRSSHWIAPSESNGCTMSCSYCYVPRRKGFANPITIFVNIGQIMGYLQRHAARQGVKAAADPVDPECWVYEIGENSDCSADAAICDNVKDLVGLFTAIPNGKLTFATKFVNRDMLDYNPRRKTRIRFSLMPHRMSKLVDIRTSPVSDRIDAMNDFYDAGYEVNVNFSPVIYYNGWLQDWKLLFDELNDKLNEEVKARMVAEIIFLTHNQQLHEVNMGWHPKAEEVLWRPELQEVKYSQTGGRNVRYKRGFKKDLVDSLLELVAAELPYCKIRYAF
ncbi:MAG TPA: spore photoproduct lyase family protein [Sphingobacteriaceae bacterium]